MTFVLIPAGTFQMGSPADEEDRDDDEQQHQVTLSQPFYLQTTPVTQGQWQKVMGNNPAHFNEGGEDCPVEQVSWDDAQEFLSEAQPDGKDRHVPAAHRGGVGVRLPGGKHHEVLLRRRRSEAAGLCLV